LKHLYKSFIILIVLVLFTVACSAKEASNQGEDAHQATHADTDLLETTSSADILPKFLSNQPENIRLVYQLVSKTEDILQWIPCYCGCGEGHGHKNNFNCFIKETSKDGTVVWTDHGTRCGVCLQIAVQSAQMKQKGSTTKEIRIIIDGMFKKGYAKPTDTKMPV
jgi:hypothetical protein